MKGRYHWPPRVDDWVYVQSRADNLGYPHGQIVDVIRDYAYDTMDVLVRFVSPVLYKREGGCNILRYGDDIYWSLQDGHVLTCGRWETIDHTKWNYVFTGVEYSYGGCDDLVEYSGDDFQGTWSTSAGGNNRWEIY